MLDERKIPYRYRDYRRTPLSAAEISAVLNRLGLRAADVLRTHDPANTRLGLTGKEPEARIVAAMAEHPTLLQRPIGVLGDRAVVGRPPENLLQLVD